MRIRPRLLSRALTLERGELFTVGAQDRTLTNLNKFGRFPVGLAECRAGRFAAGLRHARCRESTPASTIRSKRPLETDVTSKSNRLPRPRHRLQAQQQQSVPGRRGAVGGAQRFVRMADGQQTFGRPFFAAQLLRAGAQCDARRPAAARAAVDAAPAALSREHLLPGSGRT